MSESILSFSEDQAPAQNSIVQISGGAMLRKAREAAGLHIAALAVSLKVPVKKLEALETDRFDLLPDTVFVRALASSVCRTLKIDPAPVLERLPHTNVPRLNLEDSGINVPFRSSGGTAGMMLWGQLSKPFVLAVFALLVGMVVLLFFPFSEKSEISSAPKPESVASIWPLPTATPSALATQKLAVAEALAPTEFSSVATPSLAAPLAMSSAVVASSVFFPGPGASPLVVTVPGSGATTGMIVFKARGLSWVEVIDAGKVVQLRKTMTDGEVVGASGVMPLTVVVGRADTTEVQVRGKPFDLTRIAKDNVARFEVK